MPGLSPRPQPLDGLGGHFKRQLVNGVDGPCSTYMQFPLRPPGGRPGPAGAGAWSKVSAHLVEGKQVSQVR